MAEIGTVAEHHRETGEADLGALGFRVYMSLRVQGVRDSAKRGVGRALVATCAQ